MVLSQTAATNVATAIERGVVLFAQSINNLLPSHYALYKSYLVEEEMSSLDRFRYEEDQARHCIGLATRRVVIASLLNVEPMSLAFANAEHGKPYLCAGDSFQQACIKFNISHGGEWVVVAFAKTDVGIDIESTSRDNDVLAIAKHYFFDAELQQLLADHTKSREHFFDLWTLKEAYMKARGEGISLGLKNFGFVKDAAGNYRFHCADKLNDSDSAWDFLCDSPVPEHRLAIGLRKASQSDDELPSVTAFRLSDSGEIALSKCFSELAFPNNLV